MRKVGFWNQFEQDKTTSFYAESKAGHTHVDDRHKMTFRQQMNLYFQSQSIAIIYNLPEAIVEKQVLDKL